MQNQQRHIIRLWGPWQIQALPSNEQLEARECRINLRDGSNISSLWDPAFLSTFEGQLVLLRKFNCPTGLNESSRLTLETDLLMDHCSGELQLNESIVLGNLSRGFQSFELPSWDAANRIRLIFDVAPGTLKDFPIPPFRTIQLGISDEKS